MELDRKAKPRYLGPMVVIRKTFGGAYTLSELDGSIWKSSVAAFRVIPYYARSFDNVNMAKMLGKELYDKILEVTADTTLTDEQVLRKITHEIGPDTSYHSDYESDHDEDE
jgi:hypothetical protein